MASDNVSPSERREEEEEGRAIVWESAASDDEMPATRPSSQRSASGRSHHQPLLKDDRRGRQSSLMPTLDGHEVGHAARRTTFRSRTPVYDAKNATRKKYIYASGFFFLSLISFTVQTETASYITNELHWNNPYCML